MFFLTLGIAEAIKNVIRGVKTIVESIGSLFTMLYDLGTHIVDFISFLVEGIADLLALALNAVTFLTTVSIYVPPFASAFVMIFLAGVMTRIIIEVV